ncbi:cyclic lactone autoinducer peptide [Pseudobacteroides cellulosolvens]|uniref:AgrD family protein n=1 Tax=Pseudobacteroides cellulosolvens ATCC 35603 = DSM 2933 TaxID=398512 RepID=A0A0L6JGU7_9FIRM|nr:cyclic lactone autoinducer peptide [Pseudobacteroides cellulosolvens]KNY25086.1 AgrD family protein [Pseudobacteroides cellulosolvens ATCC 35603 = DSM 2933]
MKKVLKDVVSNIITGLTSNVASKCWPFAFYQPKAPKALRKSH